MDLLKPNTALLIQGRRSACSTEIFIQAESTLPAFCVEIWGPAGVIAVLLLERQEQVDEVRLGRSVSTFAAVDLLSSHGPDLPPLVSLSAVLWRRQELLGELSGDCSFAPQEGSRTGPWPLLADGGCPHEA